MSNIVQKEMIFKLRTKPTQFVRGKTEETLSDIMKRWEECKFIDNENEDGSINNNDSMEHLIDIIVTNNSLLETEQWKYRTKDKFQNEKEVNVHILSSKSNDFKNMSEYISQIQQTTNENELPNILIVCYHSKRVCDDIILLLKTFGGFHPMILPNIKDKTIIKCHISFDEPDKNLGITNKFLKKVDKYIENKTITGILFITATAFDPFWNMLHKSGIKQLENVNKDTIHDFDKDFENYRTFSEHNFELHDNKTINPLIYITDLFSQKKIDEKTRKIIFAPAHSYTKKSGVGSHDEIKAYFLGKNYVVLLMNGQFKGFIYPNGNEITLEDYNNRFAIKGELRDTLKHWSNNNINMNLAITGYNVIERGVTFNTDKFNFTDMILSNYNLKSIGPLIQLAGRGCGAKKYVDIINIFCTSDIKQEIKNRNERLKEICSLNPELYNRTDFNTSKNAIPVKLEITNTELIKNLVELKIKHVKGYMLKFHNLLVQGIIDNDILIYDNNNINKFNINSRKIKGIRMYKEKDKKEVRRFKNFNDAFNNFTTISQSCDIDEYNIDFAKDKFELNGFVNETNIFWITFKV